MDYPLKFSEHSMLHLHFNKVNLKNSLIYESNSFKFFLELNKKILTDNEAVDEKVAYYEEANKQVAILCNHQKTVSKNFNAQSESLQNMVKIH